MTNLGDVPSGDEIPDDGLANSTLGLWRPVLQAGGQWTDAPTTTLSYWLGSGHYTEGMVRITGNLDAQDKGLSPVYLDPADLDPGDKTPKLRLRLYCGCTKGGFTVEVRLGLFRPDIANAASGPGSVQVNGTELTTSGQRAVIAEQLYGEGDDAEAVGPSFDVPAAGWLGLGVSMSGANPITTDDAVVFGQLELRWE